MGDYIFAGIGAVWLGFVFWVQTRTTPISDKEVEIHIFGRLFRMPRRRRSSWLAIRRVKRRK